MTKKSFYPSISENLLDKSLQFASNYTIISEEEKRTIKHCQDHAWVKKENPKFDVTMGSFDGAEICELVGLYLLNQLSSLLPPELFGLYRDDGLAILPNFSGTETERLNKKIRKLSRKTSCLSRLKQACSKPISWTSL